MAYGSHAYGSAPYASNAAPSGGVYVDALPIVVDVALGVTTGDVALDAQPIVVDVALPLADPQTGTSIAAQPIVVDVALPLSNPGAAVSVTAAPIVVDVALPLSIPETGVAIDAQPIVVDVALARAGLLYSVSAQPIVVEVALPRAPRVALITAWTLDDYGSTAFGMEVQQEVDVRWGDPVAEAGWEPIRTNRVTWSSIEVDTATGRPRTPDAVNIDARPITVDVAVPAGQF